MSDFKLADGFGNLSDGLHADGVSREILGEQWASFANDFNIEDRADGRKWMRGGGADIGLTSATLGSFVTFSLGFRLYRATAVQSNLWTFRDGASTLCGLHINAAGQIVLSVNTFDNPVNGIVAVGPTVPLTTDTYIEAEITLGHGAGGSVDFYVNGVLDSNHPAIDTIQSGTNLKGLIFSRTGLSTTDFPSTWKMGDVVLHVAASPIGDASVIYLPADADGVHDDFTPSAGPDNFAMVDEIGPDEDVTYNESDGTAGHQDSFETAGVASVTVLSVGVLTRARKTGAGAATLLLGIEEGGTEEQSAAKGLSTNYLSLIEFFDDNPDTLAAWSPAEVTAAEHSYEVGA